VKDAEELAPEFAKEATTTETRLEPELVISQDPFWDLIRRGHTNQRIRELVRTYFQPLLDYFHDLREQIDSILLTRTDYQNQATLYRDEASISGVEERREGAFATLARGRAIPVSRAAFETTESALQQAMTAHGLAQEQTRQLEYIYGQIKNLRQYFQNVNRFMTAVMEGRTEPEPRQQQYIDLFINLLDWHFSSPTGASVFGLYLRLKYGNRKSPKTIPIYLIGKYWPEQIKHAGKRDLIIAERKGTILYIKDGPNYGQSRLEDPPPRILAEGEIEIIMDICYKDLLVEGTSLERLNEFIELFTLLSQPQNHIKVPSGQYIEKAVSVRLVSDMTNEMAQELIKLPRFSAYAKVIE